MPLQFRYRNWYCRVAVPADLQPVLGRREIVRSLRTGSSLEARTKGHHVESRVYGAFAELRRQKGRMTTDQLRALANRYLFDKLDAAETMAAQVIAEAASNPDALEVRGDQLADALEDAERRFGTKAQQRALHKVADTLIAEAGLSIPKDSPAYNTFCLWLLKAQKDAARAELRLLQGDMEALTRPAPVPGVVPAGASSVRLSEAITRFVAFKRTQGAWTPKTDQLQSATYADLVALLGDKPVAQVSKADLLRYYEELPRLPSNAAKKWRGMNARQILDATADMDIPRLAVRSVNKRLGMVRSLFAWMALTDMIEKDPSAVLKDLPEGDASEARLPFADAEVAELLSICETEATTAAQRYVPRILAYSGLRLDEAAQLTRADVVQANGVWCFKVNADEGKKIKTATAKRLVPIHSAILGDVLAYREGRPEGNLWGLTKGRDGHSLALGKWLNRRVRKVTADKRKVIHSLRHSVATKLKATGVEEYVIESLLGHTSRSMSTGRYGKAMPPEKLAATVALIQYTTTANA